MPFIHDYQKIDALNVRRPWRMDPIRFQSERTKRDLEAHMSGGTIMEYSTRAPTYFDFQFRPHERTNPDTLFMGVELEALFRDGASRVIKAINRDLPWAIVKHDGSVSGGGEICTAPATFDFHRHNWHAFFNRIVPAYQKPAASMLKAWTVSACGMHVHVSRRALTPLVLGRAMVFINDASNTGFVTHIAGRDFNSYCVQYKTKVSEGLYKPDMPRGSVFAPEGAHTVEFRIFRSNVKETGFFKNLEFVYMLLQFCRKSSDTSWQAFLNFLRDSREPWNHPNLSRFLALPAWEARSIGDAA